MPAVDYENEYDNRGRVPDNEQIFARMVAAAAAYRAASPKAELGVSYGPSKRQYLDIFPATSGSGQRPLAVFIHGGYWRMRDPSSYSHLGAHLNASGIDVAVAGYDLCPQVSIADIIEEMRAACLFLWRKRKQRMLVFGHSAGGHLTSCMVATDWKTLASDAPADLVPSALGISGVYDLLPLIHVEANADFKLDEARAKAVSPVLWKVPKGRTFDSLVGGTESSEFLRQSRDIAEAWRKQGIETRYGEIDGANHFTVVDPLTDANSAMVKRLIELANQVAAKPI